MAGSNDELQHFTTRLPQSAEVSSMEVNIEHSKVRVSYTNSISADICRNSKKIEDKCLKYFGVTKIWSSV